MAVNQHEIGQFVFYHIDFHEVCLQNLACSNVNYYFKNKRKSDREIEFIIAIYGNAIQMRFAATLRNKNYLNN